MVAINTRRALTTPARRRYLEPRGRASDGVRCAVIRNRSAAVLGSTPQREQQPHGIHGSIIVIHATAMIKVARNFPPLLRSRHDGDSLLEAWCLMLCVPRHDSEVARSVRSVEAPTLMPIAIDAAARCKGSKIVEGRTTLAADFVGALFTVTRTQSRERRFETVSNLPAVAARAASSQGTGIEDQCAATCGGGLARGGESRISGAHDQHIHRRGQSSLGQYRHGRGFLPQRRCDDPFAGHFRTRRCSGVQVPQNVCSTRSAGCGALA